MSKKDSYIYNISKEIHKGTEIASNSLEKLTDHCVEHKINRRNDKGCDLRSQLYNTWAPLSTSFFLLCSSFHFTLVLAYFLQPLHDYLQKRAKRCRPIRPCELNSPRQISCLVLKALVATYPSAGGRRGGSRVRLPWEENARSRNQSLSEENVRKNGKVWSTNFNHERFESCFYARVIEAVPESNKHENAVTRK